MCVYLFLLKSKQNANYNATQCIAIHSDNELKHIQAIEVISASAIKLTICVL